MTTSPERLWLIIADISGYTGYLTASELDHARDVMADLLETVLGAMGPAPHLSELEGDALFVYVPEADLDGSMLLDTFEACYFAFRRRIRSIAQATICPCNACKAITTLDLKFCVHSGEVVRQRIVGHEKLMGGDVILVHRLLKNSVRETLGAHAYVLFTAASLERLGLDPSAAGMIPHLEVYEHFGQVSLYVHDLQVRWNQREAEHREFVRPEEAAAAMHFSLPGPPPLVWEYLTTPERRTVWLLGVTEAYQERPDRRREVGMSIHCVHGEHSHLEEILDWHPFNSFTWVTPLPGFGVTTLTFDLAPIGTGTDLNVFLRPTAPIEIPQEQTTADHVLDDFRASVAKLALILTRDMAARTATLEAVAEARARLSDEASRSRFARETATVSPADVQVRPRDGLNSP